MVIAFDFDGTIAKSSQFHKQGWSDTLKELQINEPLENILPYEPNLKERFDSYRRLEKGFLEPKLLRSKVEAYFCTSNDKKIINSIMDLKENLTISHILNADTYELISALALNLTPFLIHMNASRSPACIISSSRRTIISAFLVKTNLIDLFDIIIGEEDLYEKGVLRDKPHQFGGLVLSLKLGKKIDYYIGDNELIDGEFASNYGCKFCLADYKTNMSIFTDLI